MRNYAFALALLLSATLVTGAAAQGFDGERVLLPIAFEGEVPGAFGSRWVTHLAILNRSNRSFFIMGYNHSPDGCLIALCGVAPTPPGITFFPLVGGGDTPARLFVVPPDGGNDVVFQLRVRDLSRQAQTWGTEIPVVRESGLFRTTLTLLDIPNTPGFRQTLRIYDPFDSANAVVRVRYYRTRPSLRSPINYRTTPDPGPDDLLLEQTVTLRRGFPAYAEIGNLSSLPQLAGSDRIRVDVEPVTTGLRFWAFVSVTNDETQHVTTITPQ